MKCNVKSTVDVTCRQYASEQMVDLELDDLRQEAYLVFCKARESYDEAKGVKFPYYFTRLMERRFIDIYRKSRLRCNKIDDIDVPDESALDVGSVLDTGMVAEQAMVYDELIEEMGNRLSGLAKDLFMQRVSPSVELAEQVDRVPKKSDYARFFGVRIKDIREAMNHVQETLIELLKEQGYSVNADRFAVGMF